MRARPSTLCAALTAFIAFTAQPAQCHAQLRFDTIEEALMGGFALTGDLVGNGPTAGFEIGYRHQLEDFSVAVALRAQYESYSATSSFPLASHTGARGVSLDESVVDFEVPVTGRLGGLNGVVFPYIGIAPGLAYDRMNLAATYGQTYLGETSARMTVHGFVGTQLCIGPGGVFFEWGVRASTTEQRVEGDSHLTGFTASLGYRLTL
jgi:hypothetical protein